MNNKTTEDEIRDFLVKFIESNPDEKEKTKIFIYDSQKCKCFDSKDSNIGENKI